MQVTINANIRIENDKTDEILRKLSELLALQTGAAQASIDALTAQLKVSNDSLAAAVVASSPKE